MKEQPSLENFEKKLENENFKSTVVNTFFTFNFFLAFHSIAFRLSFQMVALSKVVENICGEKKLVKAIIPCIMTSGLLAEFTWTGKTKNRDERKIPLKDFSNLLDLMLKTVQVKYPNYSVKNFKKTIVDDVIKFAYRYFQNKPLIC